jgi:hypothetical protein
VQLYAVRYLPLTGRYFDRFRRSAKVAPELSAKWAAPLAIFGGTAVR